MIICSHCGRENEDHYKFCLGCGSQLEKPQAAKPEPEQPRMVNCPHCGTQVPSNFKFCGACGGPIKGVVDQQPSSSQGSASSSPSPRQSAPPSEPRQPTPSAPQGQGPVHAGPGGTTNEPPFSGQKTEKQPFTEETTSQQVRPSEAARPSAPTTSEAVAKLVIIRPDGTEGATIPLKEGSVTIGRDSDHQTLANDPFLSPEHARVTVSGDTFTLEDLDSLNGIFYRIPGECELKSGDMIRLGQELLEFKHIEDVEALDAPETSGDDADTLRSGSPDVGYWGRLALISGPGITTRSFIFAEDEINIGREIGDIVFRDDGFVSGRHARIAKIDGRVILKDLGSSNGTYVRIRGGRTLEDGDLVLMGQQLFRLVS